MARVELKTFLDRTEKSVRQILSQKTKMLASVFIAETPTNILIIATPWANEEQKQQYLPVLRQVFKKEGVTAYAMVSEAWVAPQIVGDSRAPSDRDDRSEAIVILATDGIDCIGRQFEIIRDDEGFISLGQRDPKADDSDIREGRMTELLS